MPFDPETNPELQQTDESALLHARAPRRRLSPATRAAISSISGWMSLFLCIAAMAAIAAGFGQMQAQAAHLNATRPAVKFTWPPLAGFASSEPPIPGSEPATWINAEIRSGLEQSVLSKLSSDPFDRTSLAAAHGALAATGWFRDDLKLAREADGLVRVTGTWRIPAAAVRFAGEDMLVTSTGELLPVKYRPDASGYKVIVGVTQSPPEFGKLWIGGDVQAGLQLLSILGNIPGSQQIAAVDVSDYSSARSLVLVTDLGNRILWGGPVDSFNPGQATPAAKLQRLARLYREQGRVDSGRSVLDIRLIDGVYIHDTANIMSRANELMSDPKNAAKQDKSGSKPDKTIAAKSKKTASR
jgi:hypothetical protein